MNKPKVKTIKIDFEEIRKRLKKLGWTISSGIPQS